MADYTDQQLRDAAQRVANVYAKILNRKLNCGIPVPVPMTFDLEFQSLKMARSAGQAHSTMVVDLNMTLFRENIEYMLNDTIPHEMAHLVQYKKFDLKGVNVPGHGPEWREAMKVMGKTAHKFHKLDTTSAVAAYKKHKRENR